MSTAFQRYTKRKWENPGRLALCVNNSTKHEYSSGYHYYSQDFNLQHFPAVQNKTETFKKQRILQ